MSDRKSDFITEWRRQVTALIGAMDGLDALGREYAALDYGNTLPPEKFVGENAEITKPELVSSVATVEAINGLLAQGHRTNLYRVRE